MKIIFPVDMRFPMERAGAIQIVNMAHALALQGINVELIVRKMNNDTIEKNLEFYGLKFNKNLKIVKLPVLNIHSSPFLWKVSYLVSVFFYLFVILFTKEETILYTRSTRGIFNIFNFICKLKGWKLVSEIHQNVLSLSKKEFKNIQKSSKLIVISEAIKNIVLENTNFKAEVILVAHSAYDDKKIQCEEYNAQNKIVNFTYIGGIYKTKGVDTLIKAFSNLSKTHSNIKLTLVGGLQYDTKDNDYINNLINESCCTEKITITGFQEPSKVSKYLCKADVLILPTPKDYNWNVSSPVKLFEYMASGRTIISSDLEGIKEVVDDNEVMFFQAGNVSSLENIMLKNLDRDIRMKYSHGIKNKVCKFSFENRANKIMKFLG